ncbi:MAG: histidine phosphatase family protein [Gammaproteobacteria bacterium]
MSELILVRHGQASFGADSYDKLSQRGVEQVKVLCQHWQAMGEQFDHLYCGTLLRQQETAAELLPMLSDKQQDPVQHSSLNEYNGDPLIQIFLRDHALGAGFTDDIDWPIKEERLFQRVFEAATARWIADELSPGPADQHYESWLDFKTRVQAVVAEIMAKHQRGSKVVLSTSGGVIAMVLQSVLNFPDDQVINTNWMVHNSSVTRIKYGGGRVSLAQFNSLAHLENSQYQHLITYR